MKISTRFQAGALNIPGLQVTKSMKVSTGMWKRWLVAAFSMLMILGSKTGSAQLLTDDFSYTAGTAASANGWAAHSAVLPTITVTSPSLTYTGHPGSGIGNAVSMATSGEDINRTFTAVTSGSIYMSFLINVSAATATGDYPIGFYFNVSTFPTRIYVRSTAGGYNFGITKNNGTVIYESTVRTFGTTYFLISNYVFNIGSTTNDAVNLWVNPTVGGAETAATIANVTNATADAASIPGVYIRQGAAANASTQRIDAIRAGTTWASVNQGAAVPVVTSASPSGTVGTPFSYSIVATNSPTSYSIASGTLPAGLTLNTSSGAITGTPTTAGNPVVTVNAANGAGTSASPGTLSFTIAAGNQTITGLPATDTRTFGDAPYNLSATATSGLPVSYGSSDPTVATISGNTVTITGAGTTTITASQAGDADWNAAPNVQQTLTVDKATQTISFGPLADKNDTDADFALTATGGASGNAVTYVSSNPAVATIYNGNMVSIEGPGTTTITASQAGNDDYLAADDVSQGLLVINTSLQSQTITFNALADVTYGDAPFQLTATGGGSGNPVTYESSDVNVATVSGNTVTIVGPGTTTITASQAGNASYNPASPVDQPLTVLVKPLTVSGATVDTKPYDGTTAATISGATLVGVVGTDDVSVTGGGTFASADAGTHNVTANLSLTGADIAKYSLTQPTGLTGTITQVGQTISFNALPAKTFGDAPFALSATGGASGNTITFVSSDPSVATISGNTVTIVGAGSTTITASQAGNTNYSAASDVSQVQLVNKASQTTTFAALPNKVTTDAPFNLTATATSGLAVSFASSNPSVATVSGNTVTIVGAGTTNITASQAGNDDYLPATDVIRTLTVTAPLIAAWDFTGENTVATSTAEIANDLAATPVLTRGAGAAASTAANSFRTVGFQNNGISTANTDYFQTTLQAEAGKSLSLSGIQARFGGTNTFYANAGVSSQFAYSLNGTTFTLIGSPQQITSTTLSSSPEVDLTGIAALQNVPSGTTVTIRYYASGQTATGGWGFTSSASGVYGLSFTGYVLSAPPVVTFTTTNRSICGATPDGTITLNVTGTGPYTYSWTGVTGSGNPATTPFPNPGSVSSLTGLDIGFYNVTVTDANAQSTTVTGIQIRNAFAVNVSNNASISSYCANTGSITLYGSNGVPPYEYSLDNVTYQPTGTFTGLAPGNYTGYIRDAAGCINSKPISLGSTTPIVINPFVRPASSCANDGSIEVYRTGGIAPYTYSTDGITYQASNKFLNLAADTYTVYVKDAKGCVESAPVTVTQGVGITVTANKTNSSSCTNDGTIQLYGSGGVAPYTYSLDNVTYQAGNSFTDLAPNNYTGYVKDSKGCIGMLSVTITANNIVVTAFATAASGCGQENGKIQLFRTGGVGPYSYSLDGNTYQASNTFTGLLPGYYNGYVKDSKTCTGELIDIYVGPDCGQRIVSSSQSRVKPAIPVAETSLKVNAYPNPSASEFTLMLQGYGSGKVAVIVTDIMGRKIYQVEGNSNQQYRFGNNFKAGLYNVQVIQGNSKQSIKLVKE